MSNIVLTEAEKMRNGWPIIAAGRQIGTKQSSQRQLQVLGLSPEVLFIHIVGEYISQRHRVVSTRNAVADGQDNCELVSSVTSCGSF